MPCSATTAPSSVDKKTKFERQEATTPVKRGSDLDKGIPNSSAGTRSMPRFNAAAADKGSGSSKQQKDLQLANELETIMDRAEQLLGTSTHHSTASSVYAYEEDDTWDDFCEDLPMEE